MGNFTKRTISGLLLGLLAVILVLKSPIYLFKLLISIVSTLSVWELSKMFKRRLPYISPIDVSIVGFIVSITFLFGNLYLALLLMFMYAFYISTKVYLLNYLTTIVFILIYGGIAVSSIALTLEIDRNMLLILFATVWSGDIFAYIFGKSLGRKKLSQRISPKKTVEGALGGAIGSIIVGSLVAFYFGYKLALIPIILSAFLMQVGDLFESFIKRQVKVKDSSNIIPGHGGILDRIDALIFANLVFLAFIEISKKFYTYIN